MQMTNSEIVASYEQALDQKKQIGILADLNVCSKQEIVEILRKAGIAVPGNYKMKNIETPEDDMRQPETPEKKAGDFEHQYYAEFTRRHAVEDLLDAIFEAVDAYTEAPAENEIRSEAAFIGYLSGIKDAYKALYGPVRR